MSLPFPNQPPEPQLRQVTRTIIITERGAVLVVTVFYSLFTIQLFIAAINRIEHKQAFTLIRFIYLSMGEELLSTIVSTRYFSYAIVFSSEVEH